MANTCPACFEPLVSDSQNYIVSTQCGHLFHTNCVQGWMDTGNQTCPQCRGIIAKDKLLRIYLQPTESGVQKSPSESPSSNSVAYAREANSVSLNSPSNSAKTDPGTTTNYEPVIWSNEEKSRCAGCCIFLFFIVLFVVVCVLVKISRKEEEKNWLNEKNSVSWIIYN